jgi:hypothetical protein
MKTEDKVVTLAQAQRLKELGITQQSSFHYWHDVSEDIHNPNREYHWTLEQPSNCYHRAQIAAFDATELGVMLPLDSQLYTRKNKEGEWGVTYALRLKPVHASTEAQARGQALIELLEEGYITASEVNFRLRGIEEDELVGIA